MRRLIFFVLGFVLTFAMLINMGCVTVQSSILDGMLDELGETYQQAEGTYQVPEDVQAGWQPTSDFGNHWVLRGYIGGHLTILAKCDYTYMKIRGVEKWRGTYFGMKESFKWHGPVFDKNLDNLVGCVDWVKMFYYGDYMI
jgi:hypothetical protein